MWQARVRVPPTAGLSSSHIVRSLRTRDRAEALRRLPVVVAEIRLEIEAARRKPDGKPKAAPSPTGSEDQDLKDALWWRSRIIGAGGDPARVEVPEALDLEWGAALEARYGDPVGEGFDREGEWGPQYSPARERRGDRFKALVQGALPVSAELDRYLDERGLTASYRSRTKLAATRLARWLASRDEGDDVRVLTLRLAATYVDALTAMEITTATVNSHVSALHAYWKWMRRRGVVDHNPWVEQQRTERASDRTAQKRPFTDEEIKQLLSGDTYRTLHDMMRLAALSGMRQSEVARLRVRDVDGDEFNITDAKTDAGVRRVPIHPDLAALVKRRVGDKDPDAYLLEELRAPPSREDRRAAKAGERFTTYRRDLGLDDRREGRRQADADFHSFRRWFITELERAGVVPHMIAALVGHEEGRDFLALIRYSGGPSYAQLAEAVAKVRLPKDTPVESPDGPLMGAGRTQQATTGRPAISR